MHYKRNESYKTEESLHGNARLEGLCSHPARG